MTESFEFPSQANLFKEEIGEIVRAEMNKRGYGEDSVEAFLTSFEFILDAAEETFLPAFDMKIKYLLNIESADPDRTRKEILEFGQYIADQIHDTVKANGMRFLTLVCAHMLNEFFTDPPGGKRHIAS